MRVIYTLTIFISAILLFLIQPLFARIVLPLLGGSPAVWNTALVFYQTVLLLGYAYAHGLTRYARPKAQVIIHMGVLAIALISLPIALPQGWQPPTESSPIGWVLALLAVAIGLPFFAISASSPLIQAWFTQAAPPNSNPYSLYAASNVGSMIGLLGYPLLIEPNLSIPQQRGLWTAGYGLLMAMFLVAGFVLWRFVRPQQADHADHAPAAAAGPPPNWRQRGLWTLYAAVPSALLISVTTYISTDIAAIPLLWILPLALYLLTFIIIFGPNPRGTQGLFKLLIAISLILLLLTQQLLPKISSTRLLLTIGLQLLMFFSMTMVLHSLLAARRPQPRYLTEFYLWMSWGGVVGGIATSLIAPLVFKKPIEYYLSVILALILIVITSVQWRKPVSLARLLLTALGGAGLMGGLLLLGGFWQIMRSPWYVPVLGLAIAGFLLLFRQRLQQLLVGIAALICALIIFGPAGANTIFTGRNFFGTKRVTINKEAQIVTFLHGTTNHGTQSSNPARASEPLTYYTESGPLGQVFDRIPASYTRIGVVGLGTGSAACYLKPGQTWTYYEIDPMVIEIAQDPRYFSFLSTCAPAMQITVGDARLSLSKTTENYNLLAIDAYSSDAIPVHLITREALAIYLQNLAPDGVLMFHISNRYFDLQPVLANLAADAGLVGRIEIDQQKEPTQPEKTNSTWVIMARDEATLEQLAPGPRWQTLRQNSDRVWTDDYSSILKALR